MSDFLATETLIVELMIVFTLVAVGVRRLRVPYTVALVVVGLLISLGEPFRIHLTPDSDSRAVGAASRLRGCLPAQSA